jgi:SAM-dependent methyltransferase
MKNINKCKICYKGNKCAKKLNLNLKYKFITSDYKLAKCKKEYLFCKNSGFIFTKLTRNYLRNINNIYKKYKFVNKFFIKSKTTREQIVAKAINKSQKNISEILEIGPGEGNLIKIFNNLEKTKYIDVLEVNEKKLNFFKKLKRFRNFFTELDDMHNNYDVIILNQSIFHILDLYKTISKISHCLKENGVIIVITPDPLKYHVLPYIYEIFSYSSKKNIINYFKNFNLGVSKDYADVLKNQIFISFKRKKEFSFFDKDFYKKYIKEQIRFSNYLDKLKNAKISIIGAGVFGKFLFYNFRNNIIELKDDFLKINKKFKKCDKSRIIKTYLMHKI